MTNNEILIERLMKHLDGITRKINKYKKEIERLEALNNKTTEIKTTQGLSAVQEIIDYQVRTKEILTLSRMVSELEDEMAGYN